MLRDGEPIRFSGKAQKKPLDLLKAVIALGETGQLQHIGRPLEVGLTQLLERGVQAQIGRGMDDVGDAPRQAGIGPLLQPQLGQRDIPGEDLETLVQRKGPQPEWLVLR